MIYRLRTFGGLAIEPERPGLSQRKRLALLALLANAGESGLTRDKLVSYLWPESDTERARNALYQLVFGIRRELGEDCLQSPGGEIKLGTQCLASDVAEFRQALETCDFARAVAVYAGPFLDGIHLRDAPEFEQWSEATRRELQMSYHGALDRLAAAAKQTGDIAAGVRWTQLRSTSEPVSTRAALSYMSALAKAGERGAALQHAHVHAAIVRTQLDAEPGAEFERFVATLRNGASRPSAPSAAPVSARESEQSISSPAPIEPVVDALQPTGTRRWIAVTLALIVAVVAIARWAPWRPPRPFSTGRTIHADVISLSADGRHLAYGAVTMRSNISSAPITPGATTPPSTATEVTSGNQEVECISVSRDGKWLVYDSNKNGNQDIYKLPLAGGEPTQLTTDPADDFCATMSPDDREIAFYSFRTGGRRRIYTMLADGSRQRPAVDTIGQQKTPDWSPDGNQIVFSSDRSGRVELYTIARTAAGTWSALRQITNMPGGGPTRWSPDGKYFSWPRDSGIMLVPSDSTKAPFWLTRATPNHPRANEGYRFHPPVTTWGPDPSVLYYRDGTPTALPEFWSINVHGGSPQIVMRLDSILLSRRTEFATDGKRLFFTIAKDDANVWLVDLKR